MLRKNAPVLLAGALALGGLFLISQWNYLLFHSLAEMFSTVIAISVFVITWNTRRYLDNKSLLLLGIAFLFVGVLGLLHTLAFQGMGVFPGTNADGTAGDQTVFSDQLLKYTDASGNTSDTKDAASGKTLGPYLRKQIPGLPVGAAARRRCHLS